MPRVNRNTVRFDANGKSWTARFEHQHKQEGVISSKGVLVQHITTCKLSVDNVSQFARGESLCSMKDEYDWKFGIKQSLHRAIERLGWTGPAVKGGAASKEYGAMMAAFYREMRVKEYPPVVPPSSIPQADGHSLTDELPAARPALHHEMPAYNMHGLGYGERS